MTRTQQDIVEIPGRRDLGEQTEVAPRILAIMHSRTGHPGYVGASLEARGYVVDRVRVTCGEPLPAAPHLYAGVVSFGGAMSANDESVAEVVEEMRFIETILRVDIPFLGICLGAQLLARVLGAAVKRHPEKHLEAGYVAVQPASDDCDLFSAPMYVYQWHREGFELPMTARLLATGENFYHQAFRSGRQFGVQFHPEMTGAILKHWLHLSNHRLVGPLAQPAHEQQRVHELHKHAARAWLERLWDRWLRPSDSGNRRFTPDLHIG